MTEARVHLTGRFDVPLPPDEAFPLFTPLGERAWAEGWDPVFPDDASDDSAPGVVFTTSAHGHGTVWVVVERNIPASITYARTTPGDRAGTVTVELSEVDGGSRVQVTYDLTALRPEAMPALEHFAADYPSYLHSWQTSIESILKD
ncbi:SRPBCC family protein [Actinomadura harenae]|uniref:SRPBCC family protein n=1 Tax=Actinomadura harenae TaxID=2483351 RepID=A0A3M2MBG0_9ACTN|nr:SRPBCC family protein [Actinomadura harenae]RMI46340.1 SRPBCC family protein [Actinomadura harenae]